MVSHALSKAAIRMWTSSGSKAPECSARKLRISPPLLSPGERAIALSATDAWAEPPSAMEVYDMPNFRTDVVTGVRESVAGITVARETSGKLVYVCTSHILGSCDRSHCSQQPSGANCSSEIDTTLGRHKIESTSMLALRCKRGKPGSSRLVHLAEGVLVIHRREQSPHL